MNRQHGIQRLILGALVVMLATVAALGTGHDSSAAKSISDFGSEWNFKTICEEAGGTFSRDGIGNTNCHYPNGGWTQCDANGNDCWYTPPPFQQPPPGEHAAPGDIAGADPNPDSGSDPPPVANPSVTPPTVDDQDQDTSKAKSKKDKKCKKAKSKKDKKCKKGGKGRKK